MNKLLILSIAALSTITFADLNNEMLQSRLDAIKGKVSLDNPVEIALLQGFKPKDVTHKPLPILSYDTGDQEFDTLAHVQRYRSRILDSTDI